jgi:anti-sigma factor RsiW
MIDRMIRALDDDLGPIELQTLETHLPTCNACQAEWSALRAAHETLSRVVVVAPSAGFAERVAARVAVAEQQRALRHNILGGFAFGCGTLVILLLIIASSPFSTWLQPSSLAMLIRTLAETGNVFSVLLAWTIAATRVLLQVIGGGPVLAVALMALLLTMAWARLVTGQVLFRYTV